MGSTIRLLGSVRDDRLAAVPTVKALDLLRLLVVESPSARSADHYVEVLWPEADADHGRASLRTAIAQLRRAVGAEAVVRSGDLLRLGKVRTDVADLREAARRARDALAAGEHHEVVRLARSAESTSGGDLVVSGSSCDAVYAARDELRELRRWMLLDAAASAATLTWMRDSLELAQLADALQSTETSARALMTAWAGLGETLRAIETFDRLRSQLNDHVGAEPSPPTRALYLQLLTAGDRLPLAPAESHSGEAVEVARAIDRMRQGPRPGGVVWLHGEPGSGRGSIVRRARRLAGDVADTDQHDVEVLPEVAAIDAVEAERLSQEARDRECVLVVPIRTSVRPAPTSREVVVAVGRLDREEFEELLSQLLQERPAPGLVDHLWRRTGGLAGLTRRTVASLVRDGRLTWTLDGMDLASRKAARAAGGLRGVGLGVRALLAPVLAELASWTSTAESLLVQVPVL